MTLLIVIHFCICLFLVFVILLQPGKSDGGIGFGGGSSSQSIFGSRGAGNFLTKTTSVCAALFLLTSYFLTRDRMHEFNRSVISGDEPAQSEPLKPIVPAPETKTEAAPLDATAKPVVPADKKGK